MNINLQILENNSQIRLLVQELADRYRKALTDSNSIATGNILNFTIDILVSDSNFEIEFNLPSEWYYIENGRGPGKQPPTSAIMRWINIKPIVPSSRKGKVPSTKLLAFVISRSIGKKGTRGKHLLQRTLMSSNDIINKLKEEIVDTILSDMVTQLNNN